MNKLSYLSYSSTLPPGMKSSGSLWNFLQMSTSRDLSNMPSYRCRQLYPRASFIPMFSAKDFPTFLSKTSRHLFLSIFLFIIFTDHHCWTGGSTLNYHSFRFKWWGANIASRVSKTLISFSEPSYVQILAKYNHIQNLSGLWSHPATGLVSSYAAQLIAGWFALDCTPSPTLLKSNI